MRRVNACGKAEAVLVFPSCLGWFGLLASGTTISRLVFGYRSAETAARAIGGRPVPDRLAIASASRWQQSLVRRLHAYADGVSMDFGDIPLDLGRLTAFQAAVLRHCRAIPYAGTMTYGQLAKLAGHRGPPGPWAIAWPPTRFLC